MEQTLDARIDYIRKTVLAGYPLVPDLSTPRLSALDSETEHSRLGLSEIPRAKPESTKLLWSACESTNQSTAPQSRSSEAPHRQLITSTPPTIKLRATHTHQSVIGQTTGRRGSRLPRKSIRLSLATNRRPSLFATGSNSDEEDEQEDEVHRVRVFH